MILSVDFLHSGKRTNAKKTPKMFSETFPLTQRDSDKTMQIWTGAHLVSFLSFFFLTLKLFFFFTKWQKQRHANFWFQQTNRNGRMKKKWKWKDVKHPLGSKPNMEDASLNQTGPECIAT